MSVRVFYQSVSTVPCGVIFATSTSAINQTVPTVAVNVGYVLLICAEQNNMDHDA